jgi:hypothetical protein
MKTWTAVLWIVGAVSMGSGCVATGGAAPDEDCLEEATPAAAAPEAICRRECHQRCHMVRGVRTCRRECHSVCR